MAALSSFTVRVPASTSNLGPGFDTLGLALNLYTDYTVRLLDGGPSRLEGRAAGVKLHQKECPFFPMMDKIFALTGAEALPVEVLVNGEAPIGVGLGWSAAARVAGAVAANTLLGNPLSTLALLAALVQAEGHPDNVSPSLMGGLTASVMTAEGPLVEVYQPAPTWRVVILIPDYTLWTEKARRALPREVPLVDAVFNLSRVPFVLSALVSGNVNQLAKVLEDRLHEPFRGELIKRYGKIRRAALEAGAAATFISGAGPAQAAFCAGETSAKRVMKAMLAVTKGAKFTAQGLILQPEPYGVRVAELE